MKYVIHLWLVDSQEIWREEPLLVSVYTSSCKWHPHGMHAVNDLIQVGNQAWVWGLDCCHNFVPIMPCLGDVWCTQIATENSLQMLDLNDSMIWLGLRIQQCHQLSCKKWFLHITLGDCRHDYIKAGLCIFIVVINWRCWLALLIGQVWT